MALSQDDRFLNVSGAFEDNELFLVKFEGKEELSRPFRFELELISEKQEIDPTKIIGKQAGFSIATTDDYQAGPRRYFNGYVSRFYAGFQGADQTRTYRAVVVPWFWFLTRQTDCRIFQDKTLQEILEQIIGDRGFTSQIDQIQLSGAHPRRPYTVQYNESDFNFLSRLMEEEGVWYSFKHEEAQHKMLIADSAGKYFDCAQKLVGTRANVGTHAQKDYIREWNHRWEFRSGKVSHSDYNDLDPNGTAWLQPSVDMAVASGNTVTGFGSADDYERFEYPGGYADKPGDGKDFADVRLGEEEIPHDIVEGESICRAFTTAAKIEIDEHYASEEVDQEFVVTSVEHFASETNPYHTGAAPTEGYSNKYSLIPAATTFRPARVTRKPSVQGIQTAIVVGDDDIPVDELGRVRVKFPWIRPGKSDPDASCLVRVSQNWAGAEWGGLFNPHKGQEVLVAFLDGDPDRPVITGRVYNQENKVPVDLPANKTKSVIRDHGDNQLVMEGKPDEQFIILEQDCGRTDQSSSNNKLILDGTAGQEYVMLQDKDGNKVHLDSQNDVVTIYAAHNHSGVVYGKENHHFSHRNQTKTSTGNLASVHVGSKTFGTLGYSTNVMIGSVLDVALTSKIAVGHTNQIEWLGGTKISYAQQASVTKTVEENKLEAQKDIILDAGKQIRLAGEGDMAQAKMDDKVVRLTFQKSCVDRSPVPQSWSQAAKVGAMAVGHTIGLGGSLINALSSIDEVQPVRDPTSPVPPPNPTPSVAEHIGANLGAYCGALMPAVAAAFSLAEAIKKKKEEKKNMVDVLDSHDKPEAEVNLSEKGVKIYAMQKEHRALLHKSGITLDTKEGMGVLADKNIQIQSRKKNVKVTAKEALFGKTKIRQKNLRAD